jgi:hypothetical protein
LRLGKGWKVLVKLVPAVHPVLPALQGQKGKKGKKVKVGVQVSMRSFSGARR